jgi:fermentation-respiration switch protein FrsA (DUF1100 family)
MNAERAAEELVATPIFIAHGKGNLLHPIEEALALFDSANEPKELYLVNGQHNDFMYYDHPEFVRLMENVVSFFAEAATRET